MIQRLISGLWRRFLFATLQIRLRTLGIGDSAVPPGEPGIIVIQIDGLGYDVLTRAIKRGKAPFLSYLLRRQGYTLKPYFSGVPSITTAVEAELFYGKSDAIPAFSWFHRQLGLFIRGDQSEHVKILEQTLFAGVVHPLVEGGTMIAGAYSGRAAMTNISPAYQAMKSRLNRWLGYRVLLVPLFNPFRFWRMLIVLTGSVLYQFARATKNRSKSLFLDEFATLMIRLFLCDLASAIAVNDIWRKTPALFLNLSLVDKVSHAHGIRHEVVFGSIRLMDLYCKKIYEAGRAAPRAYRYIVLSDHGQSPGIPFAAITGETLETLLTHAIAGNGGTHIFVTNGEYGQLNGPIRPNTLYAIPSSSICHIYFSRYMPRGADRETIEADYPHLIPVLLSHPGIGWIMMRQKDGTRILLARAGGSSALFQNGKLLSTRGKPIDLPDASVLLVALARLSECENNGDLVIFGGYHANAWASFEPYWGTHGSFTGEMVRPFMLTDDAKLITLLSSGASHRDIFRRIRQMRRG